MKLILASNFDNEEHEGHDFSLVDLTPDLAKLALARIELVKKMRKKDSRLYEMWYWDYSCQFFHCDYDKYPKLTDLCEGECVSQYEGIYEGADEIPEDLRDWTECDQMVAQDDCVKWSAIQKHGNIYVNTAWIPLALLQQVANQEEKSHA